MSQDPPQVNEATEKKESGLLKAKSSTSNREEEAKAPSDSIRKTPKMKFTGNAAGKSNGTRKHKSRRSKGSDDEENSDDDFYPDKASHNEEDDDEFYGEEEDDEDFTSDKK